MKKYLGYTRVSTDEQVNGFGLEAQRSSIEAYAMAMGYDVERIFQEEGESGAKTDRPVLQHVLEIVRSGDYAGVIVMKLDRLSRNLKDILIWHDDVFIPKKTNIISVKEQFDTGTAVGKLMFQMIGGFAEFERTVIKERVMAGKVEKAKKGKFAGGSAAYGYDLINGHLVVNERQAEIVRQVFTMRQLGMTFHGIAEILNVQGIPTRKGAKWTRTQVWEMVQREEFYKGTYIHGSVVAVGQHQPILSEGQRE
jgi:site-specific DNA recombinase